MGPQNVIENYFSKAGSDMAKLGKEALDKLLISIEKYLSQQLLVLQMVKPKIKKIFDENKHDNLQEKKDEVCEAGRDENGDITNPETEEALEWLENEGVPNIQESLSSVLDSIDEPIQFLEEKLGEIRELMKITPKKALITNRKRIEDGEEDEDSEQTLTSQSELEIVIEAVRAMPPSGRFGREKVFISDLWENVHHEIDMNLREFKKWLIRQNREQKLDLARADLVGAMNPKQVQESEIEDMGSSFHFVIDRSRH